MIVDYCLHVRAVVVVVVAALIAASCAADDSAPGADVTVFAAASLTAAFTELGDAFSDVDPDVAITFSFAGSSDLAAQIVEGAPADVFASADLANMARVADAGAASGSPTVFATNTAEIIVEAGNPKGIAGVADLADDELVVVQCAPQVPCGAYAEQVLATAGVDITPDSFEASVSGVVTKVTLGEADAGIVYRTDVLAAGGGAEGVVIPDDINVVADYPVAVTSGSSNPDGANRFIEFVQSDAGRAVLASYGFGAP